MSVKIWTNPNDPNPADPTRYKIGTEGLEHGREGLSGFILELFRKAYPLLPVQSILGTLLVVGSVDVAVPTYGLWAGPGWSERIYNNYLTLVFEYKPHLHIDCSKVYFHSKVQYR